MTAAGHTSTARPRWLRDCATRSEGVAMLRFGASVEDVAQRVGVNWRTVYRWKESAV